MLRAPRTLGLVCAPLLACLATALMPAVALADSQITGAPQVIDAASNPAGPAPVGQPLTCNTDNVSLSDGTSGGTPQISDYSWYDWTNGARGALVADTGASATYTPQPSDTGNNLVCQITASDGNGGDASATSNPTDAVTLYATVTITSNSPAVSGNIGESVSGVVVGLTLKRDGQTVGSASTTTNGAGAWSTTLIQSAGPQNVAYSGNHDELDVAYSGATPLPPSGAYRQLGFPGTSISPDGTTIEEADGQYASPSCSAVSFIVDGASHASSNSGPYPDCVLTGQTLTDTNHVQTALTASYDSPDGSVSGLTLISDAGLVGVAQGDGSPAGAPVCNADLVSGHVTCSGLGSGSYSVSNGTSTAALIKSSGAQPQYVDYTGDAPLAGLQSGQTVTLTEQGTGRSLATLHVGTLVVHLDPNGAVTGSCTPEKLLAAPGQGPAVCSSAGTIPPGVFSSAAPTEQDDLSGGITQVSLPSIGSVVPTTSDTMPDSGFTAYADLVGRVAGVSLSIRNATGTVVFSGPMTVTSDSIGPYASVPVPALSPGRYTATWDLTDTNGDTIASAATSEFNVQAGPTPGANGTNGSNGAAGPAGQNGANGAPGPRGPAGQNGTSSQLTCLVTKVRVGKGRNRHIQTVEKCTVSVLTPGTHLITVQITHGRRLYARGTARSSGGQAKVHLRLRRAMTRARYLVTVVIAGKAGTRATVLRYYRRLG